jgi:hypothetical protein
MIQSEAIEWKQKFLGERCSSDGRPPTTRTTVTVNEVLDDYLSYMTLKGRKSVKIVSMVFMSSIL